MRRQLIAIAALAGMVVGAAEAQTRQVKLEQAYGWGGAGKVIYSNVVIGPYGMSSPGLPNFDVFCVDFTNSVSVGNVWTARFTSLGSFVAGNTRFGQLYGASVLDGYKRAAWLAMRFALNPASPYPGSPGSWPGIHQAIWKQFGTSPSSNGWANNTTGWEDWADKASKADLKGINWDYWYVVTDVSTVGGKNGKQEYLTYVTPEPETLLLLATGLAAVIGYAVISRRIV